MAPLGSGGINELHLNSEAQRRKSILKSKIDDLELRDCTFQPLVHQSYKFSGNHNRIKQRDEKLRELKWNIEQRESNECTFRPYIHSSPKKCNTNPQQIPGLELYMQRRRLAEDLREEKREREEKVFLVNLPETRRRFTKPEPFQLSS